MYEQFWYEQFRYEQFRYEQLVMDTFKSKIQVQFLSLSKIDLRLLFCCFTL